MAGAWSDRQGRGGTVHIQRNSPQQSSQTGVWQPSIHRDMGRRGFSTASSIKSRSELQRVVVGVVWDAMAVTFLDITGVSSFLVAVPVFYSVVSVSRGEILI